MAAVCSRPSLARCPRCHVPALPAVPAAQHMRGAWRTACVILSSLAGSLAAEKSAVHELTEKDYDKFVADNTAFVISFTAPWCGHSRALRPEYEKAAHGVASQGLR